MFSRHLIFFGIFAAIFLFVALLFFEVRENNIEVRPPGENILSVPEAGSKDKKASNSPVVSDIESQKPLPNPPSVIKAIYLTSWSGGSSKKINYVIDLKKAGLINAVVVDIKDFSGIVAYDIQNPDVIKYGAKEIRIPKINLTIKKLHDEGIYVVARITVFQDPVLATARLDLAVKSSSSMIAASTLGTNSLWKDRKGLSWIDPAATSSWDYFVAIVKDAASRGFDELNFDYIRFPSDGDLNDMLFPHWDEITPKHKVIKKFFKYLRGSLPNVKISADLFGLATVNKGDMGIGQIIEDAYEYFDYVSPMVYPSHYATGFLGYVNPATAPYEVVKYSLDGAFARLKSTSTIIFTSKLRPWLQDFDLGADYNEAMVELEIQAVKDALGGDYNGFMLWNPSNIYTKEALHE